MSCRNLYSSSIWNWASDALTRRSWIKQSRSCGKCDDLYLCCFRSCQLLLRLLLMMLLCYKACSWTALFGALPRHSTLIYSLALKQASSNQQTLLMMISMKWLLCYRWSAAHLYMLSWTLRSSSGEPVSAHLFATLPGKTVVDTGWKCTSLDWHSDLRNLEYQLLNPIAGLAQISLHWGGHLGELHYPLWIIRACIRWEMTGFSMEWPRPQALVLASSTPSRERAA